MNYEVLYLIVEKSQSKKIKNLAKTCDIKGVTTLLASGTINHPILDFLELNRSSKEILIFISLSEKINSLMELVVQKTRLNKKNGGIAFTIPLVKVIGSITGSYDSVLVKEDYMYKAIYVVVEKGMGEFVVDASNKVGGRGATIINARGSSKGEVEKIFAIEIEPEKELVFILAKSDLAPTICESIRTELELDLPGKGIIFVQDVSSVYGVNH